MSFKGLNLSAKMVESLSKQGYFSPSDNQVKAISAILRGENLLFKSPTGSGKTHAYLIPIIEKISKFDKDDKSLKAIIISPTIELNRQIYNFASAFKSDYPSLTIKLNDDKREREENKRLNISSDIVIATAPNAISYLKSLPKELWSKVPFLVLDEADLLFDEDHKADVIEFLSMIKPKQILAMSASLKNDLRNQIKKFSDGPVTYIGQKDVTSSTVTHIALDIKHKSNVEALLATIKVVNPYLCLVFSSKKKVISELYSELQSRGIASKLLIGDMEKRERKNVFDEIKEGKISLVLTSDLFARGIDLEGCDLVISLDLPKKEEYYLHRAGRAGRFYNKGQSIVFVNKEDKDIIENLETKGVKFKWYSLNANAPSFKEIKPFVFKNKVDKDLEKEISIIKAKYGTKKKNKVKPGYKKARAHEIEHAKWYARTRKNKNKLARAKGTKN